MPLALESDTHYFDKYRMLLRLQLAAALGCAFILLYSFQFFGPRLSHFGLVLRIASVGILAAGAALFVGFVLGFIFCIPRTAKPSGTAAAATTDGKIGADSAPHSTALAFSAIETNTNLVDISDWLTKILVGVGLVELNKIPSALWRLAHFMGPGLRECDSQACIGSSEAFAAGIVIFFFGAGFLIGYLWTRLHFQRALSELADLAHRVNRAWLDATSAELLMREGLLDEAMRVVDRGLQENPSNSKAVFSKARILKRLAQAGGKPGDPALLREALQYALKAAELLPNQGGPLYNMACYQALLGADKNEVLKNLKRAIQLSPKLRREAQSDEDLVSLREDADFKELIKDPTVPS